MGLSDLITQLPELIGQAVEANQWLGYTAIFAAMFLENLFPPIPIRADHAPRGLLCAAGSVGSGAGGAWPACWAQCSVLFPGTGSVA